MFSEAISSISWRCRPSSPRIAEAISGSASVSVAVKNESGAELVLLLAEELVGGVISEYLPRRSLLGELRAVLCGGRSDAGGIPYRAARAKRLRYKSHIYARYG